MGSNKRGAKGTTGSSSDAKKPRLDPNTTSYVQILGTGMDTLDTSPSVLLFFDHQRFIFNVGEGLQRFCTEYKIKLSKTDHVFLTRVCSETAGGLPGLLLTLAGIGEKGILVDIWGPSNLKHLVNAMRSFVPNAAMVHTHSFGELQEGDDPTVSSFKTAKFTDPITLIDDEVVRISAIVLRPGYTRDMGDTKDRHNISDLSLWQSEENLNEHLVRCSHSLDNTGSTMKPGDVAVIYICELPDIVGALNKDLADIAGVKCKTKYGELKRGNPVMSDTKNELVHPSHVLEPSTPGSVLLLVDCPTLFHMKEMLSLQSLHRYYVDSFNHPRESIKSANCIIHLGPASVTKNTDYQMWMKRFGNAQHIMAGHEIKDSEIHILKSSARISSRLNFLCPQLFPAPGIWPFKHFNNHLQNPDGKIQVMKNFLAEDLSPKICESISAENLLKFNLRPFKNNKNQGLDRSVIPKLVNHAEFVNELLLEIPEIINVSKHLSQFWKRPIEGNEVANASNDDTTFLNGSFDEATKDNTDIPACLENITREDMEIILLGTGSSQPSKYRNVSSILVNLFSKGTLLVDCGEGTLAQLRRRFGVEGADNAVKVLHCIWISHIHADHHSGLVRILSLRSQLLKGVSHEPLLVIGPKQLKRFLDAYCVLEDLDMMFLDCRHTTQDSVETLLRCHDSHVNYSPELADHEDDRHGGVKNAISQCSETSIVVDGDKTESNGKNTEGLVDSSIPMPVLTRYKEVLHEAGLEALYSFPVVHCHEAFGLLLKATERINNRGKANPGWKLVYSGDTRPCQSMIDASRDATILIHEATFEDSMGKEAIAKNHSTTMEALGVGASAGVYRIILTHFSQRYPKIPVFDEAHMQKACVAFDLMSINLADLPVLPKFLPCLKVLFKNEIIEDELL